LIFLDYTSHYLSCESFLCPCKCSPIPSHLILSHHLISSITSDAIASVDISWKCGIEPGRPQNWTDHVLGAKKTETTQSDLLTETRASEMFIGRRLLRLNGIQASGINDSALVLRYCLILKRTFVRDNNPHGGGFYLCIVCAFSLPFALPCVVVCRNAVQGVVSY
jgi:hypothetical protein